MTNIHDILLPRPISDGLAQMLLFFIFTLHLFFILVLIGTAIIGLYHFFHSWSSGKNFELRWDKHMHKSFLIPKAIGVVLGVGALLVIQLYYAIPFYTATSLFGPFWLIVIALMVVSFLCIDGIGHTEEVHPYVSAVLGTIGVFLLLWVPATFVTIIVTMENSDKWLSIARNTFHLDSSLIFHWLMRYLHIIGASIVFGAAFQFFFSTGRHDDRKRVLIKWMIAGMLFQFLIGGLLAMTLQQWLDMWTLVPLAVGIGAAGLFVWIVFYHGTSPTPRAVAHPVLAPPAYLLPIVLVAMLLTREFIQHQKVMPAIAQLEKNAATYRATLDPYNARGRLDFASQVDTVYDNGVTIFNNSCSFCHALDGSGNSPEAASLVIPPERISQARATRAWIYTVLVKGYPGAGMPYFSVFDKYKLDDLVDHLDDRFNILDMPGPLPVSITDQDRKDAEKEFNTTCSLCHNIDGRGIADYSRSLRPAPPDFTEYNLTPQRAFEVIRDGYPGTAMRSFKALPENLRWGLVHKVNSFRKPGDNIRDSERQFHALTDPEE